MGGSKGDFCRKCNFDRIKSARKFLVWKLPAANYGVAISTAVHKYRRKSQPFSKKIYLQNDQPHEIGELVRL